MIVVEMRVFPFSFPPIRGGAQGGVSPTPTPEPDDPYDFDNAVLSISLNNPNWIGEGATSKASINFSLSGIVAVDVSDVSSFVLDFGTMDWAVDGVAIDPEDISNSSLSKSNSEFIANPSYSGVNTEVRYNVNAGGQAVGLSGDATITVYDANGQAIQTGTITAVVS